MKWGILETKMVQKLYEEGLSYEEIKIEFDKFFTTCRSKKAIQAKIQELRCKSKKTKTVLTSVGGFDLISGEIYDVFPIYYTKSLPSDKVAKKSEYKPGRELEYSYATKYNLFFKSKYGYMVSYPRNNNLIKIRKSK